MNLLQEVEAVGSKVEGFLKSVVSGGAKLRAIYSSLSGPVIAASMAVFYDVVKTVAAAEGAATAAAAGNVPLTIKLSETTLGLVEPRFVELFRREVVQTLQQLMCQLRAIRGWKV